MKKRSGPKEIIVLDGPFQIFLSSDLLFLDISCVFLDFLDFLDLGPTVQVGPLDPEETPASERATHRIPHAAGRKQSIFTTIGLATRSSFSSLPSFT